VSPRLDKGTKLVDGDASPGSWHVTVYPDAGEAVVSCPGPPRRTGVEAGWSDPDANRKRAGRRAVAMHRRYCAANRLDRQLTLTFAPPFCTDPIELRCHLSRFVRRLRHYQGGEPFAWLSVPEFHKDGVRLHAHMAVGFYIPKADLADLWGHGFVDVRKIRARRSTSDLDHARQAARYLSKYLGKAFDQSAFGRHRYEVGQGFQPRKEQATFGDDAEARTWAKEQMGGRKPGYMWSSKMVDDWAGPPTEVVFWS
jgi:hypothetical protein